MCTTISCVVKVWEHLGSVFRSPGTLLGSVRHIVSWQFTSCDLLLAHLTPSPPQQLLTAT